MSDINVMVVDDDALVAFHLQRTLTSLGYKVVGMYASGEEAVEEAERVRPDVILMDIQLRDSINGIQAAQLIRQKMEVPVIFISAYSDDTMLTEAKLSEPYGYLIKPVKERELHATLEMALFKSRMDKQLRKLFQVTLALRSVNQLISGVTDEHSLCQGACDILIATRNYQLVWIGLLNQEGCGFSVDARAEKTECRLWSAEAWKAHSELWPSIVRESVAGACTLVSNRNNSYCYHKNPALHCADQPCAVCTVPLRYKENILGLIWVSSPDPEGFDKEEQELLEELAADLGLAFHSLEQSRQKKQYQGALEESEEKYRSFIEETKEGIALSDEEGRIIIWNKASEQISGVPMDKAIGRFFWDVLYDQIPQEKRSTDRYHAIREGIQNALRTGQTTFTGSKEVQSVKADGSIVYTVQTVFSIRTSGGFRVGSIVHDITENKMAEQALVESERRFRQLFEDAPLGYQSLDVKGHIIDVNQTWLDMLGYEREEVIGKWFGSFISEDAMPVFKAGFARFIERGNTQSQYEVRHKSGELLVISFDGKCAFDPRGNFLQTHCILSNITEKSRIEKELENYRSHLELLVEERTRELGEVVSLLNATLESTGDGIMVTGLDGRIGKYKIGRAHV